MWFNENEGERLGERQNKRDNDDSNHDSSDTNIQFTTVQVLAEQQLSLKRSSLKIYNIFPDIRNHKN